MSLDPPAWQPAVADVAARITARTRGSNGALAGTFNSSTTPTDTQVTAIIGQVVASLRARLGNVPDRLADQARSIAALRAAYTVELSFFPEQVESGVSPYRQLFAEYTSTLKEWDTTEWGDEPGSYNHWSLPVGTLYPGYATGTF